MLHASPVGFDECSRFFQDVRLKVVILELLAVCVETQPGLTEMFLNVQPATTKPSATTTVTTTTTTSTTTGKDTKDTQESKKVRVG